MKDGPDRLARTIVFDVNETLLDVSALEPHFSRAFGDTRVLRERFSTVLLCSEAVTLAGVYADFSSVGRAALDMTATSRNVSLSSDDRDRILRCRVPTPRGDCHEDLPQSSSSRRARPHVYL